VQMITSGADQTPGEGNPNKWADDLALSRADSSKSFYLLVQ
jgi:hypothetical protein